MTHQTPLAGAAPGLPVVSRRTLLRASPARLAPALLAGPALASTETPIQALYARITALEAHINDLATPGEESERLYPVLRGLEDDLSEEPLTCTADLAIKVLVLSGLREEFSNVYGPALKAECEALVAGALA